MRDGLNDLFVFAGGDEPLFLAGSAGNEATQIHGMHFIPSESATNGALLDVFEGAISANIANFPLSATVSSQTFVFVGGVPSPTSDSYGPIFTERAQTLGRGRFDVGLNVSSIGFSSIRGTPMDDVRFTFVHQNVDFPGCDDLFGGDCTEFGIPSIEHDVINLNVSLDLNARIYAFAGTFGVTDWLDLSVAVPVVKLDMVGESVASVVPTGGQVLHFFGGTPEAPVITSTSFVDESTSGIGDVAVRGKARFMESEDLHLAALAEARLPTGRSEDFLGTGEWSGKVLFLASGRFGAFSPHLNAGYLMRSGSNLPDAFQLAAAFDQRLAEWATFSAELLSEFQVGGSTTRFPEPVTLTAPYVQHVDVTNIPNIRDDRVDGVVGFKFRTGPGIVILTSAMVALNEGGMRANVIPTFGLQFNH